MEVCCLSYPDLCLKAFCMITKHINLVFCSLNLILKRLRDAHMQFLMLEGFKAFQPVAGKVEGSASECCDLSSRMWCRTRATGAVKLQKTTLPLLISINAFCLWFHSLEQMKLHLETEYSLCMSCRATARRLRSGTTQLAGMLSTDPVLLLLHSSHSAIHNTVVYRPGNQTVQIQHIFCSFLLFPLVLFVRRLSLLLVSIHESVCKHCIYTFYP